MDLNQFVWAIIVLFFLGVGTGCMIDRKFQCRKKHLVAIVIAGALLLIFGIP
jgi:hypothetical protein